MSERDWLEIFADNLLETIRESGYSQQEVADEAGLAKSTITRYVHKQQMPTIKAIINLSYALNCDINDLIDFGEMIK